MQTGTGNSLKSKGWYNYRPVLNNTEVAGPPPCTPPTHTHSPGLSSGVAGELSTPGLDCTERVGDTGGSGLSTGERN